MGKFCMLISVLFCISFLYGQETSPQEKSKVDDTIKVHSPKKAGRLSLMAPGAGQIYNHLAMPKGKKKAWWKVPLIYAGLGATGYLLVENHIIQRDLKDEFNHRMESSDPNPNKYPEFQVYDDQGVLQLYESHKGTRDMMIFAFLAVYGLNFLDALVEAHFVDFDVSPDLSMGIRPVMQDVRTPGITLSFNFR